MLAGHCIQQLFFSNDQRIVMNLAIVPNSTNKHPEITKTDIIQYISCAYNWTKYKQKHKTPTGRRSQGLCRHYIPSLHPGVGPPFRGHCSRRGNPSTPSPQQTADLWAQDSSEVLRWLYSNGYPISFSARNVTKWCLEKTQTFPNATLLVDVSHHGTPHWLFSYSKATVLIVSRICAFT